MKIAYTYSQTVIDNLDWISEWTVDHDICDTVQDAKHEILRLSRIIEKLTDELNEKLEKDQDTP